MAAVGLGQVTLTPVGLEPHVLVKTTFSSIQTCQHCRRYLLGVVSQGFVCKTCDFICHPSCVLEVSALVCLKNQTPSFGFESNTVDTPVSASSLEDEEIEHELVMENLLNIIEASPRQTQDKTVVELDIIDTETSLNPQPAKYSQSYTIYATPAKYPLEKYLRDIIELTEEHELTLEKKRNKPASDLVIALVHNFTQFILKITAVRILFNYLFGIITWKNPHHTIVAISCHITLCLYPSWLLILSFIAAGRFIYIHFYGNTIQSNHSEKDEIQLDFNYSDSAKYYLASLGFETAVLSAVMAKNPRNILFVIQLMEGYLCVFDNFFTYLNKIKSFFGPKWLHWVTAVCLPVFLLGTQVPFRYIMLLGGAGGIIFNHPVVRAVIISTASFISHKWDIQLSYFTEAFKEYRFSGIFFNDSGLKVAKVYENQRWWAISGWASRTLTHERTSWSDETGQITYESIKNLSPLSGYKWDLNSQWEINKDWIFPIKLEEEAWIYCDNEWNNPASKPQLNSYTRRRLWFRKMVPVNPSPQI